MEELLKVFDLNDNPVVVIVGAICLAIIALASFSESIQKLLKLKKDISPHLVGKANSVKISRRKFLFGAASVGFSVIGGYVLMSISKIREPIDFISKPSKDGYLIANKKTGAIHHSKICKWHLPDKANQVLDFKIIKKPYPHDFRNINIYEVMAKQLLSAKDFDEAVVYYKKAIDQTPERVHLYDNLAKLYGRQKKYRLIKELYENGEKKINAKLTIRKNKQQLTKVKNDIRSRLEKNSVKYNMA